MNKRISEKNIVKTTPSEWVVLHQDEFKVLSSKIQSYERDKRQKNREVDSQLRARLDDLTKAIHEAKSNDHWRINSFNIFEILRCCKLEEPHSNILAWLLDPNQGHGLNEAFLMDILERVFRDNITFPDLKSLKVRREAECMDIEDPNKKYVDIEVSGKTKDNTNWWLIIENKVGSKEYKEQTKEYHKRYRKKGGILFEIYLSPYGDRAKSHKFQPVTYNTIRKSLSEILKTKKPREDVHLVIQHFIENIYCNIT